MEGMLQQIMGKLEGVESKMTLQNSKLEMLSDRVQAVQADMALVKGDMMLVKGDMALVKGKVDEADVKMNKLDIVQADMEVVKFSLDNSQADMSLIKSRLDDVVKFAREKRTKMDSQAKSEEMFIHVLHIVASAGYDKDVLVVFSLNKTLWNDVRLWRVIINKSCKHKVRVRLDKEMMINKGNETGFEE